MNLYIVSIDNDQAGMIKYIILKWGDKYAAS